MIEDGIRAVIEDGIRVKWRHENRHPVGHTYNLATQEAEISRMEV
jgi:hypothetical protein